jgi:Pyridoxamine 5'-phosphate oxidase
MGKVYPELDQRLRKFIASQPVFFVATAPCLTGDGSDGEGGAGEGGHVNVSPKGYRDTFAILGPTQVAYLDLTGSGAETIAHLRQNGRITLMFCSFGHEAKIVRLYGTGRVVLPGDCDWDELAANFPRVADAEAAAERGSHRAIIVADLDRISDSCGYAVPVMELKQERSVLDQWAEKMTPAKFDAYRAEKNAVSIDGLPALAGELAAAD